MTNPQTNSFLDEANRLFLQGKLKEAISYYDKILNEIDNIINNYMNDIKTNRIIDEILNKIIREVIEENKFDFCIPFN